MSLIYFDTFSAELAAINALPSRLHRLVMFEEKIAELLDFMEGLLDADNIKALRRQQGNFKLEIKKMGGKPKKGLPKLIIPRPPSTSNDSATTETSEEKEEKQEVQEAQEAQETQEAPTSPTSPALTWSGFFEKYRSPDWAHLDPADRMAELIRRHNMRRD